MHHAITIADLPGEIICEILKHLPPKELIEKALVCKLWNELIASGIRLKRLTVDSCTCNSCKSKWLNSSRRIHLLREFCHENLFILLLHRPILSNLKYCSVELSDTLQGFKPNDINAFSQLIHFEIEYWAEKPMDSVHWTLPNLETLKLSFFRGQKSFRIQVTVDCPKLKNLAGSFPKYNTLNIKSPQTVTTLALNFKGLDLTKFKNVEVYRISTEYLKNVDDALLKKLPNLQTLDLYGYINGFDFGLDGDNVEIKPLLKRLLDYKRKAMRSDSSLFVAGIHLKNERSVDDLDLQMIEFKRVRGSSKRSTTIA